MGTQDNRAHTTKEQSEEIVEFTIHLLGKRLKKHEIKRLFRERYSRFFLGPPTARTIERYIRKARDAMEASVNRRRAELTAESLATYEGVIRDPNARPADRISAQREIDHLLRLRDTHITIESRGNEMLSGLAAAVASVRGEEVATKSKTTKSKKKSDGLAK